MTFFFFSFWFGFFAMQKQQQKPLSKNCDLRDALDLVQLFLSWDKK